MSGVKNVVVNGGSDPLQNQPARLTGDAPVIDIGALEDLRPPIDTPAQVRDGAAPLKRRASRAPALYAAGMLVVGAAIGAECSSRAQSAGQPDLSPGAKQRDNSPRGASPVGKEDQRHSSTVPAQLAAQDFPELFNAKESFNLHSLRGRVVLLEFWETYCIPCRANFPLMNELARRYAADGLAVIALSTGRAGEISRFASLEKNGAPSLDNSKLRVILASAAHQFFEGFDVKLVPTTILIDESGRIVFRASGSSSEEQSALRAAIGRTLRQSEPILSAEALYSFGAAYGEESIEELQRVRSTPKRALAHSFEALTKHLDKLSRAIEAMSSHRNRSTKSQVLKELSSDIDQLFEFYRANLPFDSWAGDQAIREAVVLRAGQIYNRLLETDGDSGRLRIIELLGGVLEWPGVKGPLEPDQRIRSAAARQLRRAKDGRDTEKELALSFLEGALRSENIPKTICSIEQALETFKEGDSVEERRPLSQYAAVQARFLAEGPKSEAELEFAKFRKRFSRIGEQDPALYFEALFEEIRQHPLRGTERAANVNDREIALLYRWHLLSEVLHPEGVVRMHVGQSNAIQSDLVGLLIEENGSDPDYDYFLLLRISQLGLPDLTEERRGGVKRALTSLLKKNEDDTYPLKWIRREVQLMLAEEQP